MQEVTCFRCGHVAYVTPDASNCPSCGQDLQQLIPPEFVSGYFYERASHIATGGNWQAALAEVERGLVLVDSAELRLLAAILAKRLGRFEQMRRHVAAIPVDDSLRPEAEWLIRSHQEEQRLRRAGARRVRPGSRGRSSSPATASSAFVERAFLADQGADARRAEKGQTVFGLATWTAVGLAFLLVAAIGVGVSWWGRALPSQDVTSASATATGPEPGLGQEAEGGTTPTPEGQPTPVLTPIPSATIPGDLVLSPTASPALADAGTGGNVLSLAGFDLERLLREAGHEELLGLGIQAQVQGNRVILQGIVHLDAQRRLLKELLEAVPGVAEVSTVNLLLRPLPTYTVQAGDTLWSIAYDIYGDPTRKDDLYAQNRDILRSPDALDVGMVLKVPPLE
ncbi:LysM peptidoglycan-binding domain-containing protein [Litorilinea aerophila]|uniref:LysM peptidoglycan-binding domain-containing protein n=1 Tax=Litorilinea aerophila TaxID=1204385 RepID=A0A540VBE3_9CHLR|nr:LysM peptidoglycan-binding domain-containing protein [Litorilinea aerophila]MCC9078120.1 LysM peptidoglycan-binding domain-containing protein [Litorilinea aerophila]